MTGLIDHIYAAAANAGLLKQCRWHPANGSSAQTHFVGFYAADDTLLDGLALGTEYWMSYPAGLFKGLTARDTVDIAGTAFQVRDIRAVGDGTEIRARLARVERDSRP